jgi:hypothetical protein
MYEQTPVTPSGFEAWPEGLPHEANSAQPSTGADGAEGSSGRGGAAESFFTEASTIAEELAE